MNILFTLIIKHLIRNMNKENNSIDNIVDTLKNKVSTIANSIPIQEDLGFYPNVNIKLAVGNLLINAYNNIILFSREQLIELDCCYNKFVGK